jgi:hypothetical protein
VKIDFERMARRARQLTSSGDSVGAMAVTPDGKTLVFVTSGIEGGRSVQSIWSVSLEGAATPRRLTQAGRSGDEDGTPSVQRPVEAPSPTNGPIPTWQSFQLLTPSADCASVFACMSLIP